jgi:hypothetical protein
MTCPFLEEIVVRYCKACPVKKMVPVRNLRAESPCVSDFSKCPAYQDIVKSSENGNKECIWARQKLISYRLCTRNFDCKSCELDQTIIDMDGRHKEAQETVEKIIKFK